MMKKLFRRINTPGRLALLLMLLSAFGAGIFLFAGKKYIMPGPVSAAHVNNQALGGYVSHAEFEKECIHCHAPVHCVTDTRCQDCHMDIARERATAAGLHGMLPGTSRCQTCHVEHQGREASITTLAFLNVDHTKLANFSLDKHHQDYQGNALDCETCHSQGSYGISALDCITCHTQEDHQYMADHIEAYGTRCIDCHDGSDRMLAFDHDQYYPLEGGHDSTGCIDCHAEYVFIDAPADCKGCHAEPEMHAGVFGEDCARCHTAAAWAPAQLTQHTFLIDHGTDDITECETCHAGSYTEYPCYTCHDFEEMRPLHVGENSAPLEDCIACHPTGRESEIATKGPDRKDG